VPLKLVPPRQGKTPYFSGRGTYLGFYVDRTTKTADRRQAQGIVNEWKRQIERGEYAAKPVAAVEPPRQPTFADAALAYLRANGDPTYLRAIIAQTGAHALRDRKLTDIDQAAIDNAGDALYPRAPATTKNRQFYTPVSAVLKRAGIERKIRRPKGWRGSKATEWLEPEQAFALIGEACKLDAEFGLFCLTLCYTGRRLSETLDARLRHLKLDQALLYMPDTKNGEPSPVHLPPIVVQAFRAMPPRPARVGGRKQTDAGVPYLERNADARIFRFHAGGWLRGMLAQAMTNAQLSYPPRMCGFHLFCHTYGTWMTRYGNLDTMGLVRTGRWKGAESADRYNHTLASEEARRADLLPVARGTTKTRREVRRD
jgi:integrase